MTRRLATAIACVMLLALAGCLQKDKYTLVFSHVLHVKDNKIECADCHGEIKGGRLPTPGHDICSTCHEDLMKTNNISVKTCGVCHKEKDAKDIGKLQRPAVATNALFVHTAALKGSCADCHDKIASVKADHVTPMTRGDITRIRQMAHGWRKSCDTCHSDMSPLVRPASHNKDWVRRHGPGADSGEAVCAVCHQEETCKECHQATKPSSHNALWRVKSHGAAAEWDRAKCQLCHQQDSCKSCHDEVRPRSHVANWKDKHCDKCHSSEAMGGGCGTCHEADIGMHPDPHGAGWLNQHCTKCHDGSPAGNQCILCHKDGLEAHPNPHGAGWQAQHCSKCHSGTPEGDQCALCHASAVQTHPNPHGAGWLNQHCNSCHPGTPEGDQCLVCHKDGVSTHPDPHGAGGLNVENHCNTCHVGTPQYEQCLICHRGGVGSHPNPHGAGGLNVANHCNTCHVGTPEYEKCLVCHAGTSMHPDPHSATWLNSHCLSCHASAQGCNECHPGGTSLTVHDSVWPSSHTAGGFGDQTDCFVSGCHDVGSVDAKRRKARMLLLRKFIPQRK